ncbi:polyphosphate kinase 1, partial [Eubacteriales bacterium OttesenSCG-928-A19]|nr:polyphosphate kinase 1 [Eubacteriales bacterium OttesenSCG-928-A19]
DAVLRFIRESASDPRVLAINITLYRVSGNSPVIWALCAAAEAGKRVTVLLELKARFDEENNIHWAEVLRRSGCEVIYGMPRLKTHSKITLVVRREGAGLRRYMHLGTGNYNDVTATQYTDMGILTCDEALGEDAQAFFNMITGFSKEPQMRRMAYAPRMLREALYGLIRAEIEHARAGRASGITAKMNSLVDPGLIALLYEASAARVPVRLIVRGICCLRAGVPGLSESIEVRSIVGRFLEHSRIFRFENGGDVKLYLSSADWMPRNLNRRIELMFPIVDDRVRAQVEQVLEVQLREDIRAWQMASSGRYVRVPREGGGVDAQEELIRMTRAEDL